MKTPGQTAYEEVRKRAGLLPWRTLKEAEVEDWEVAAAAVLQPAIEALQAARESLKLIGGHPQSFWDTAGDLERIDSLLGRWNAKASAMSVPPNDKFSGRR